MARKLPATFVSIISTASGFINSGLNHQFMEYSPGWVLLGYLLKWSNENGIAAFDFMRGDEEYKYRFGSVDRQVKRVVIKR